MSDEVLENFIRQYIQGQGGEPTLPGLEFFEKVAAFERKYASGKQIENDLQTNGVLLDDPWCEFLRKNNFLVGLGIDGPQHLHNKHRVDKAGKPTLIKSIVPPD
jgi:uncharacterized protein